MSSDWYVAKEHIYVGEPGSGAIARARGSKLSGAEVKERGAEDLVVGANTKEARQILADLTGEPLAEPTSASSSDKKGEAK